MEFDAENAIISSNQAVVGPAMAAVGGTLGTSSASGIMAMSTKVPSGLCL